MSQKVIEQKFTAQNIMMGLNRLKQPLPMPSLEHADPFLLLHHIGLEQQRPGEKPLLDVGAHPHRGFEPVSFIFSGELHHRDSRGNDSIISAGGVQWMTAGRGIVHSEQLPKEFIEKGGAFEMIQLWINLPSQLKMVQPKYQGFEKSDIPSWYLNDNKGQVNVISGSYRDLKGPVDSITQIKAYTLELKTGAELSFQFSEQEQVIFYQLRGESIIGDSILTDYQLAKFNHKGTEINLTTNKDSLILVVAGRPFHEPIVSWGPYVMNSQTEIMEAMRDYQMGKMGILI